MPSVPPGISFLLQNLPSLVAPPATILVLGKIASNHIDAISSSYEALGGNPGSVTEVPTWVILTLAALSLPTTIAARIVLKQLKDERDAAKHNAVLPPMVKNAGFAGVALLKRLLNNFAVGYPGECQTRFGCLTRTDGCVVR
jgi:hypothetical protein